MPLHLLDGPETPQEHVRQALMLLDELERAFRGFGLMLSADEAMQFYAPLAAARNRLWRAVSQLEERTP